MNSILDAYPHLRACFHTVDIAALPTPLEPLPGVIASPLHVKRDDLSGAPYGGNKVRKLAVLLGHAQAEGFQATLTYGCVGSNHALATAIYASRQGLRPYSVLYHQPVSHAVRRNLLRHHKTGATMSYCASSAEGQQATRRHFFEEFERCGRFPLIIAPGGSSPVGTLGFVAAAFELHAQVRAGRMPMPDVVYVPSGTMGTCIGLALGFAAAGMRTHVMGVAVTVPPYTSEEKARRLFDATRDLLRKCDASFPEIGFDDAAFTLRHGFLGEGYGRFTEVGSFAVRRVREAAGIGLEGTYTGKAFSALLADAETGALDDKTALFWDTYNARDLGPEIADVDYRALPASFHRYFEEEVQALDQ
jgi:D-cysteine desulfhydrase